MIKIKYLGTGAAEAVPGLFCDCVLCRHALDEGGKNVRMRSSAVINDKILVDLSPDFAPARANFKIDTSLIDIVLVTHTHQDHFNINMLSYNCPSFTVNPRPMRMYLSRYAARMLKKSEIEKKEEALANITLTEAEPFAEYKECDYTIVPLEAAHSAPQSLLYLISYQGKTLLYGNDTGMLTKKTVKYLKDRKLDIVSLDATSGKAKGHKDRHMGFGEIVNLKDYFMANGNCDKNSAIIATHFSHFIGMPHDEIEKYLKGYGRNAAYDGMEVER